MKKFKTWIEEDIERRADQKTIMATDPHTGKNRKES